MTAKKPILENPRVNMDILNDLLRVSIAKSDFESARGHKLMIAVTDFISGFKHQDVLALPSDVEKLSQALLEFNHSKREVIK